MEALNAFKLDDLKTIDVETFFNKCQQIPNAETIIDKIEWRSECKYNQVVVMIKDSKVEKFLQQGKDTLWEKETGEEVVVKNTDFFEMAECQLNECLGKQDGYINQFDMILGEKFPQLHIKTINTLKFFYLKSTNYMNSEFMPKLYQFLGSLQPNMHHLSICTIFNIKFNFFEAMKTAKNLMIIWSLINDQQLLELTGDKIVITTDKCTVEGISMFIKKRIGDNSKCFLNVRFADKIDIDSINIFERDFQVQRRDGMQPIILSLTDKPMIAVIIIQNDRIMANIFDITNTDDKLYGLIPDSLMLTV